MKTTVKNIALLLSSLFLLTGLSTAQTTAFSGTTDGSSFVDPVAVIHQNIANLEFELETLRMQDKRLMSKAEKRAWKRKKRFTRRKLNQQRDMLSRLTNPAANMGYYGYYGPYGPWNYNPYYRNRVVVIRNNSTYCPPVNSQNNRRNSTTTTTTTTTTTRKSPVQRNSHSVSKSVKHSAQKLKIKP